MSQRNGLSILEREILKLVQAGMKVTLSGRMNEMIVELPGPGGTPYEGGKWDVRVLMPRRFPFEPPFLGFVNKMFHPNVDFISGAICMNVINHEWIPTIDLLAIFQSLLPQVLMYPNPEDHLNSEAATLYTENPEEFVTQVKAYVKKFASPQALVWISPMSSSSNADSSSSNTSDD